MIKQTIDTEAFVLGSEANITVKTFEISNNMNVKFLPKNVGIQFPNLSQFVVQKTGLTVVRNHYFKHMQNLERLYLNENRITSIDSGSFNDLISVEWLECYQNMIVTLDARLFATMVRLDGIDLNHNKIKFLDPQTFKIPGGKLRWVDMKSNACNHQTYAGRNLADLEGHLRTYCVIQTSV